MRKPKLKTYIVTVREEWRADSEFRVRAANEDDARGMAERREGECLCDSGGWEMVNWEATNVNEVCDHA